LRNQAVSRHNITQTGWEEWSSEFLIGWRDFPLDNYTGTRQYICNWHTPIL
jgi:hypothetical protein